MDFWETTSGLFSFSATLGSTVDTSFRQSRGDTTSAVLGQGYVVFYARPVETTSWSKMDVSFTFRGGDEAFGEEVFCQGPVGEALHGCRPSFSRWLPGIPVQRLAVGGSRGAVFVHEVP